MSNYIYFIRRSSDKYILYVGTSKNPEKRFKQHLSTTFRHMKKDIELLIVREYEILMHLSESWMLEHYYITMVMDFGFRTYNKAGHLTSPFHKLGAFYEKEYFKSFDNHVFGIMYEYFNNSLTI